MTVSPLPDVADLAMVSDSAVLAVSHCGEREVVSVGDGGPEAVFRIASLTKPFTAVATIQAAASAGVSLDTPVLEVLDDLREGWNADTGITIRHVLAQTAGLRPSLEGSDVAAFGQGEDALLRSAQAVVAQGSVRVPGQRWEYYNGNYFVAGAITARLTGASYEQALRDLVLVPYGLRHTSFSTPTGMIRGVHDGRGIDDGPYPRGRRPSGGLTSTAADLLTLVEHVWADPGLLSMIQQAQTRDDDPMQYGLGWALGPSGQMYLNGRLPGYRTVLLMIPERGFAVCGLANDTAALPAIASWISSAQQEITGDELAAEIDAFAA